MRSTKSERVFGLKFLQTCVMSHRLDTLLILLFVVPNFVPMVDWRGLVMRGHDLTSQKAVQYWAIHDSLIFESE